MSISKIDRAQILILASNYANYEASIENAYERSDYNAVRAFKKKSTEAWLKLKELVDGLTEE